MEILAGIVCAASVITFVLSARRIGTVDGQRQSDVRSVAIYSGCLAVWTLLYVLKG